MSHGEWLYAFDDLAIEENFSFPRNLKEKDLALIRAATGVGKLFDEKDASVVIELDLAIDQTGNRNLHGIAACFFRDLVDNFLWESVKEKRAVAFAPADNRV